MRLYNSNRRIVQLYIKILTLEQQKGFSSGALRPSEVGPHMFVGYVLMQF